MWTKLWDRLNSGCRPVRAIAAASVSLGHLSSPMSCLDGTPNNWTWDIIILLQEHHRRKMRVNSSMKACLGLRIHWLARKTMEINLWMRTTNYKNSKYQGLLHIYPSLYLHNPDTSRRHSVHWSFVFVPKLLEICPLLSVVWTHPHILYYCVCLLHQACSKDQSHWWPSLENVHNSQTLQHSHSWLNYDNKDGYEG